MGFDDGKMTAEDYRSWGYVVNENRDLGTLQNGTYAYKKDKAIALCLYLGNANAECSTVSGARSIASELRTSYARFFHKWFPVSTEGLALELMYHAIPDDVLNAMKQMPNLATSALATAIDVFGGITTSCYWADCGVNDRLRILDGYATDILDFLDSLGF